MTPHEMVERTCQAACAAVGTGWEIPGSDWEVLVANSRYGLPSDPSRHLAPLIEAVPRTSMSVEASRTLDRLYGGCFQREGGYQALRDTLSDIVDRPLSAHMLFNTLMKVESPSAARVAGVVATARARVATNEWSPTREYELASVAIPQHYQMLVHFRRNDPVAWACTQLELAHVLLRQMPQHREPAALVVAGECLIAAEAQLREVGDYHRELVLRYHLVLAQTAHSLASGVDVAPARIAELSRLAGYTDRPELAHTARMLAAAIAFRAGDPQRSAAFLDLATGLRVATGLASSRHYGAIPNPVVRYEHDVTTEVELALTFNRRDLAIDSVTAMVQRARRPEVWRGHELVERIDDPGLRFFIDQQIIEATERAENFAGRGFDGVAQWQHALIDALSYGIDSARNAGQHDTAVQWRNRRDEVLREFNRDVQRGIG